MLNIDILSKILQEKVDAKLRQMQLDPEKNTIYSETAAGDQSFSDPTAPTWGSVTGKPTEFPPETHGNAAHSETYITAADIPAIPDTFTDLTDTPADYAGQAGRAVLCDPGETGLVFGTVAASGGVGGYSEPLICASSGEFLYASNNDILSGKAVLD